jgi:hypothetical protein
VIFTTLGGNEIPLGLAPYKIKWKAASLSKFQTRIKKFFCDYYSHLEWYEEVPLSGKDVSRLRWDFLCVFEDKTGQRQKVFVEVQGFHHNSFNPKFQKNISDLDDQMYRDELKKLFAEKNSKFPVIEFFEDDKVTIEWFEKTYPRILPRKNS